MISVVDRPRGARLAAVFAVPVLCLVGLIVTVWLDVVTPDSGPGVSFAEGYGWGYAMHGVVLGVLSTVILVRDDRQPFGWLMGSFGLFWVLDAISQSYIRAGIRDDGVWPGMTFTVWFYDRFGGFLPVVIAAMLLVFPTGRFLSGAWGMLGKAALGVMVASAVVVLVVPAEGRLEPPGLPHSIDPNPTTVSLFNGWGEELQRGALAAGTGAFLVAMALVVVRYRQSAGLMRDRMRWLVWSVLAMAVFLAITTAVDISHFDTLMTFVTMVLPAGAMTVAIVQPSVVPIADLLSRTVVFAAVALVLLAADILLLATLTAVLDDGLSVRQVVAVVLLVAVVLYGPLRTRLSATVRRLMLGERGNPYDALAGLASTLETTDDADSQLEAVTESVARAFGVGFVGVEVERESGRRLVASYGSRPDRTRTLPITYRGSSIGNLVLPARGVRSRLSARDEQLLGDLVRQAATAARTSRLADEVQRSRERLVTAREEERRRIRRDLHDGLGPALSGAVFQLEAARISVDSENVRNQLGTLTANLQDIVADVRRLVHDLRPPALDDRGLVGALIQQAERLELDLVVDSPDLDGRLPAAVEVAAYRIIG
ncbi:MAG: histidine kinase [Nocardiaceae bacterium]|nr:histidine kinase [Nocardiaceae bacterium]